MQTAPRFVDLAAPRRGRLGAGAAASIIGALVDLVSSFERERAN